MPQKPPVFRPSHAPTPRQTEQAYEGRRGSARQRGYSPQWDKRSRFYRLSHPLCLGCKAIGRIEQATLVDHILPHRGDPSLMWDESNWQPSCKWHHDVIKQLLEQLFEQGKASKEDLRLNSAKAMALTKEYDPGGYRNV